MKNKITTWKFIANNLQSGVGVMLLYVVESFGSSPGRRGFFMAVNIYGEMEGSLGGGIMEHKLVEKAKATLKSEQVEVLLQKQLHNKTALKNQSGMICSGEQTILLYTVQPHNSTAVNTILDCLITNKKGLLTLSYFGLSFTYAINQTGVGLALNKGNDWLYTEIIGYTNHLYLVGGGHCALALSKMMQDMDFYITVFDDRQDLHTMQRNQYANQKVLLNNYSELETQIEGGDDCYVVVMTFGYRTDYIALRILMQKRLRYLGVLGSAKKIEKMFADYKNEGIPDETLKAIHAPVGLAIKSQTPEEIAVSIAAEVIKIKNAFLA